MTNHSNGILELTAPEDVEVQKVIINDKDYIRNPFSIIAESLNRVAENIADAITGRSEE